MEIRGEMNGILVLDDFGHHPTAIRETLKALRIRFPDRRVWAIFEPRSNTTRRNVFQKELVAALREADVICISKIARLELLNESERLNPERLIRELKGEGREAFYLPSVDSILERVLKDAKEGDVICTFSNGGFENIHIRLLENLKSR